MENIFLDLINFVIGLVKNLFGVEVTPIQMATILAVVLIVVLIVTLFTLEVKTKQLKKLRKQILNQQIQVVTVQRGKKGKTKRIIRTTKQLRNPKKNNKVTKNKNRKFNNKGVTNIRED